MRPTLCVALIAIAALACGGDSTSPNDVFPNSAGVYNVTGTFDGLSSSDAHFEGTLTLTQASRASGALGGSAAYLATINGSVFNLSDSAIDGATISPTGVITYTLVDASGTWTFTGTLSGTAIVNGRHTISGGSSSFSGAWSVTRATATTAQARVAAATITIEALSHRLMK
jgi:hypothetical protein